MILAEKISKWKKFFLDYRKTALFVSFVLMLPVPCFYIVLVGILPAWRSFFVLFIALTSGPIIFLIGTTLVFIHLIITCYIFRFIVNIIDKILSFLPSNLSKNIIVAMIIITIFIIVWNNNLFFMGDVGGGSYEGNLADIVKGKF